MVLTAGWMMRLLRGEHLVLNFDKGGSPPPPPPVPDPSVQIAAEARANRYNVISPFGTQKWFPPAPSAGGPIFDQAGYDKAMQHYLAGKSVGDYDDISNTQPIYYANGPEPSKEQFTTYAPASSDNEQWTQQITLDPSQQRQFDARNQIAELMLGRANEQLGRFSNDPFAFSQSGTGARAAIDAMRNIGPSFNDSYGNFNPNVKDIGEYIPAQWDLGTFNPNVRDLGTFNPNINAPGTFNPNVDDTTARALVSRLRSFSDTPWSANVDGSRISDAVYRKAKLLLDPTYERMQQDLDQRLVNQGLPIGSEAYGQANDVFGRERSNAYERAALDAILQGANEEQNQFARALSTRQQSVADVVAGLSGAQSQTGAEYGRNLTTQQQREAGAQADYNRQLTTRGQLTAEQQADYARQLATRGQQAGEQGQRFAQGLNTRQQLTAEQQADYARQLATRGQQAGEFGDDFARRLAQQQGVFSYEQALMQSDQARQLAQRQQQYNELAALLGGQQLTPLNPSGGQIDTSGAFANQQAALNRQYQGQLANYNAGVSSGNSAMGGLFGLGAAALPLMFGQPPRPVIR